MTGMAGVSERPCVRAREWLCELKNDPTLAPPGEKTSQRAAPRLAAVERQRARLDRGTKRKRVGLFPFSSESVRGCTGTWICAKVRVCACCGHNHGGGRDNGGDTTTGKNMRQNEEESPSSGATRAAQTAAAPTRSVFPAWLDRTARVRRRGSVSGHSGELTRLDVRPRLEGRAPQEGKTMRRSPTVYATRR
jgi:hypothetical protein